MSHDISVSMATEYELDGRGSIPGEATYYFLRVSIPALGPTELTIQWIPRVLTQGLKRQEREADHSPPTNADVKNGDIPPFPTHLHVIMLN
jgi:hypothetical protein